jgi:hypothetical protein
MIVIMGQMDAASKIFDYLYLGTEWNASNWEELAANKCGCARVAMPGLNGCAVRANSTLTGSGGRRAAAATLST